MNIERLQVPFMLVLTLLGAIAGWGFSQALGKVEKEIESQRQIMEEKLASLRAEQEIRIHNLEEHVVWRGQ